VSLLAQIPLAPPLDVRLVALAVVEVVLLVVAALLWVKYTQLKKVPVDEWWERRKRAGISPRVERMMRESHDQWLAERRRTTEGAEFTDGDSRPGGEVADR
jgi:hypothetical protein